MTNEQLQQKIEDLESKLQSLVDEIARMQKQMIVVVGDYDGTNVPVTVHGIRRKIATVAP